MVLITKKPDFETYIVKNNDSLFKIANKFNTNVNTIKDLNNLQNDIIMPGMLLLIPNA